MAAAVGPQCEVEASKQQEVEAGCEVCVRSADPNKRKHNRTSTRLCPLPMCFCRRLQPPFRPVDDLGMISAVIASKEDMLGCLANLSALLTIDASPQSGHIIPETLFGIFFEEINHAGAGGIWAELVNNRGKLNTQILKSLKKSFWERFEAGGPNTPSNIDPWAIIGNESSIYVSTDRTSCFSRNEVALKMKVFCGDGESVACPDGVGIYNPGFWGMNIEEKKTYNLILYVKSLDMINITVSLTSSDGLRKLASANIIADATDVSNWTRVELQLEAMATDRNARLQLTTMKKGIIWFDQISLMPLDTYKGHGFRKELISMIEDLKPQFIRFPGGCFVEGEWLRNAFRWRETIGPWEERPGHFGDVWMYWTDDGLGYLEFLQLAEDIGAAPIWDVLDSIEFARGSPDSKWGSLRAEMGHPEPFQLEYVAVGNEDCWKKNYKGNYLKFYYAIKAAYPDIKIISNCDGSSSPLDHPADFYDFHVYTSASSLFMMNNQFDRTSRIGPKAFVSEYAVTGSDAGNGSLLASLGEAAFLIGVERNRWNPDAIVFNSWQQYGTPSYWMQHFFRESSGATFHPSTIQANFSGSLVINFGKVSVSLKISINGLEAAINSFGSATILTSDNLMDENSFAYPNKVVPVSSVLPNAGRAMDVVIAPQSLTAFDLPLTSAKLRSAI
ncbi:hypothetical protein ZIOFF_057696 [Zingiber officinale]|uniref:non-reducing end alpha-L-arabinofuranosidase n=1 Tax=Zingiber officinale TaxID=94328 RepID=A0A8J5FCW5_ZINOF|nr:hypothetical protein ZIOFF_057696 [Zingiber officinale]